MSGANPEEPQYPFLIMNQHFMCLYRKSIMLGLHNKLTTKGFKNGRFKEKAVVIDINCMQFRVIDVLNLGRSLWPLHLLSRHKLIKVKYIYGEPVQLTYEEARHEIVELICRRGWYTEVWQNEKQFRETRAQCKDMAELLESVSFFGKWVL
jgi:hypothetical protein